MNDSVVYSAVSSRVGCIQLGLDEYSFQMNVPRLCEVRRELMKE